jgi:hypothetical protein
LIDIERNTVPMVFDPKVSPWLLHDFMHTNFGPGANGCHVIMQRTAVVLIEYQNDFTTPNGVLHEAVKGVMARYR